MMETIDSRWMYYNPTKVRVVIGIIGFPLLYATEGATFIFIFLLAAIYQYEGWRTKKETDVKINQLKTKLYIYDCANRNNLDSIETRDVCDLIYYNVTNDEDCFTLRWKETSEKAQSVYGECWKGEKSAGLDLSDLVRYRP
jgi:hypothetical protein